MAQLLVLLCHNKDSFAVWARTRVAVPSYFGFKIG